MNSSSDARNPVERLAEDFLERKRRGEHPTLREYVERHPELAEEIRDLFPALLMMEDLGEGSGGSTGSLADDGGPAVAARLERLGDYRILREIGRGGMGVVYEAEQESLGRRVALKVLSAGSLLDPKQVRRFEREAKAAARLHHTNIVPVFGVGHQDGHHYFVMQFIAGLGLDAVLDDLRRLRRSKSQAGPVPASPGTVGLTAAKVAWSLIAGRFDPEAPPADGSVTEPFADATPAPADGPPVDSSSAVLPGTSALSSSDPDRQYYRSVARIGIQTAEALDYANRQGILHRDIKPSNLLLDNHGNVWVADFGLAKTSDADDLTHTGDILGTIRYMAPERFSGHCDARSDVYSLGLTLYELVALRPAYEASDRHTLMDRVLHEEPERLKKVAPGVPRDLETIVAKAIARDPAMRYATAAALAEDLRRFVEDRPIRARRISPVERLARWCRRNPWLAGSMGVAASALVAVAALSLLHADRQARHAAEQARANQQIRDLAGNLKRESDHLREERGRLKGALSESNSRLARLDLERGQAAFEKDQVGLGMVWTLESLKMATEAGDAAARRVALDNLAAWRRSHVDVKQVFSHDAGVTSVAFSPDGKTIATGSWDRTARLWDVAAGRPIGRPLLHEKSVRSVAFSPDGRRLATAGNDTTARLWDAATGQQLGPAMPHSHFVFSVAFSPDGRTVVTACGDGGARLWDTATGRQLGQPMQHSDMVWCAAFSPDGKTILTGSWDRTARLWDAATGRPIGQPIVHPDNVYSGAFSADGRILATGGRDRTARFWDADTGRPIGEPIVLSGMVVSVAFSPDGKTLLTGSSDRKVQTWDVATGQPMGRTLEHQRRVEAVAFSPDGKSILAGCGDFSVRLWDHTIGRPIGRMIEHGGRLTGAAISPDGKTIITRDDSSAIRRWDVAAGRPVGHAVKLEPSILAMALSPDGRTIATGSDDTTARLWDAASGRPLGPPMRHSGVVFCVAFAPDGKTIATACRDNTARLWDAATGRPLGPPMRHSDGVFCVAFSPDGKTLLTGSFDNTARRWDAATGRPLGLPLAHSGPVYAAAFSPDGRTMATGSQDGTVRLWEAATGRPLGVPLEHNQGMGSVAFSPGGRWILAGYNRGTARIWDAATGQVIGPPLARTASEVYSMTSLAIRPDGTSLLTCDGRAARLWQTPTALPDDLPRLSAWVKAATGLELDERGSIRVLDSATWLESRRRLEQLGGPPPADPVEMLDPILFGADPAARGDAWKARGFGDRAEAAYAEASRARPLNRSTWEALARWQIERNRPGQASATLGEAIDLMPDDLQLRLDLTRVLLSVGDRGALRKSSAAILDRFGTTSNASVADSVAWACALEPDATANLDCPVRLAELAVQKASAIYRANSLNTLGASLYRAGRFDVAIHQLEETIRLRGGVHTPRDCVFLAMAHHRQGHRAEAGRWLDRLQGHQPSADPNEFWNELEIRLLRREAEAVILHDPAFPDDPFAR